MKEYYIRLHNQEELDEAIRLVEKLGYQNCHSNDLRFEDEDCTPYLQMYDSGDYGLYNYGVGYGEQITIDDLKEISEEPNIGLNWLKERMDKYYFQLHEAVSAEEDEDARIIAARLDELEYVYNKLKG